MTPKLSIVCVTFNHEKYISQALDGFLCQRVDFPLEILVGDDGSTDATREIIESYARNYPSIVPVLRPQNIGAIPNFADLFGRVQGEYAALCDGDDYWTDPGKLGKQVALLENNPGFSMCFHPVEQRYDDDSEPPRVIEPFGFFGNEVRQRGYFTMRDLIKINFIPSLSAVYRYKLHGGVPDWLVRHKIGDYPMHLLHAATGDIGYLNEIMGVYRKHASGLWWRHDTDEHHARYMEDFRALLTDVDAELDHRYADSFASTIREVDKIIARVNRTSLRKEMKKALACLWKCPLFRRSRR